MIQPAGQITDPKHGTVTVYRKKGETSRKAMERVRARHAKYGDSRKPRLAY